MKGKWFLGLGLAVALLLPVLAGMTTAQEPDGSPLTSMFTYQGRLKINDAPYSGFCDLQFGLWDELSGGTQVGEDKLLYDIELVEGYFTVVLDWLEGAFVGEKRFLDITARCPADSGTWEPLSPRLELTSTPYALYAKRSPWPGLLDVPADFADGVDNDTIYIAGPGLVLTETIFSADLAVLQRRVSGVCGTGYAIREVFDDGNVLCEPVGGGGGGNAWLLAGNSGTTPGYDFVGTTDDQPLVFKVNGERALRLEPTGVSPNLIGGHIANWAWDGVYAASIGGGGDASDPNIVTDAWGTIGGGAGNQAGDAAGTVADAQMATIGGGFENTAGSLATVGGGWGNLATGDEATVGGGFYNQATGDSSAVAGGYSNTASGIVATVSGGSSNEASGDGSAVGGGYTNTAFGSYSTLGGGYGNVAEGYAATVPGGLMNEAEGDYSFAAGRRAAAWNRGCFVWGDSTDALVSCGTQDTWVARASGGVAFYSNAGLTSGVWLAGGGNAWNGISDRATKENFSPADGSGILERLASLPVQEYNLKSQDESIRHVGLVAQDFATFGYGESDKAINMQDADGVALAAIQALYTQVQEKDARIAALQQQNAELDARLTALEQAAQGGKPQETGRPLPVPWLLAAGVAVAGGGGWAARRRTGGAR